MNKFTEEQIRDAFKRCCNVYGDMILADTLITELSRPAVEFQDGEVVCFDSGKLIKFYKLESNNPHPSVRKQSTKESGAGELIKSIVDAMLDEHARYSILEKALNKWREERNES